jgi:YD repeat-containing protein
VWQQTYYRDGSPLRATDPVGALTEYTYDTLGRKITEAVSEGGGTYWWTTNLAYDDAAHLVSATSPARTAT